jgi:hypothetical protein
MKKKYSRDNKHTLPKAQDLSTTKRAKKITPRNRHAEVDFARPPKKNTANRKNRLRRKIAGINLEGCLDFRTHSRRAYLTNIIMNLFDIWNLGPADRLNLLNLSCKSGACLQSYRKGGAFAYRPDRIDRVIHLLSIHLTLRALFPENLEIQDSWIKTPNKAFECLTPLQYMKDNRFLGILTVRNNLESQLRTTKSIEHGKNK